jgi:hypothetical protein
LFQKAIDILKVRWQEVTLIVVLQAAMMLLYDKLIVIMEDADSGAAMLPFWAGFLVGIGSAGVFIVWLMLYLGFLKTAATEGESQLQPGQLVRHGRPYFWRYLFFNIQIGFLMFLLSGVLVGLFASIVWNGEIEKVPEWFARMCALGVLLILIKPMLFIPARILVYENTTLEAFFSIRQYQMGRIHKLNQTIAIGFSVILLVAVVNAFVTEGTVAYYIVMGIHHLLFSAVPFFLTLLVVLWVQEEYNTFLREQSEVDKIS